MKKTNKFSHEARARLVPGAVKNNGILEMASLEGASPSQATGTPSGTSRLQRLSRTATDNSPVRPTRSQPEFAN